MNKVSGVHVTNLQHRNKVMKHNTKKLKALLRGLYKKIANKLDPSTRDEFLALGLVTDELFTRIPQGKSGQGTYKTDKKRRLGRKKKKEK